MPELVFSAEFEIDGFMHRLDVAGERVRDLRRPLARCGGYLRARAKRRIDEGKFEPLKPSTLARKLNSEQIAFFGRFGKRQRAVADSVMTLARQLERALSTAENGGTAKRRASALIRAEAIGTNLGELVSDFGGALHVKNVAGLIALSEREMRRRKLHGAAMRAARALPLQKGERRETVRYKSKKTGKQSTFSVVRSPSNERRRIGRVGQRRYKIDARTIGVLGGLRDSIHLRVEAELVIVFSGPPWSGVHNKPPGQKTTVGNRAEVPGRQFLVIVSEDVKVFVSIFSEYLFEVFVDEGEALAA